MALMEVGTIAKVRNFHKSFPEYSITPLAALDNLANALGVGGIYVKDESHRFGMNAFKGLGASFALVSFIAQKTGRSVWELDYNTMISPEIRKELGDFTFFATTDGNHGRAVAWAARKIGQKAVIYMPKGCPLVKLENIKREGAEGYITEQNYDDTIRFTAALAKKRRAALSCRTPLGRDMKISPGGSCRGTACWPWKHASSYAGRGSSRPICLYRRGWGPLRAQSPRLWRITTARIFPPLLWWRPPLPTATIVRL
jgi:diaminopropionate ammonia-lyase family